MNSVLKFELPQSVKVVIAILMRQDGKCKKKIVSEKKVLKQIMVAN